MKINKDKGTVTISRVGVRVEGTAKLHMWGGGIGYTRMDDFDLMAPDISLDISDDDLRKKIKDNLNDAGFGCESIDGAIVDVYDLYESGFAIYTGELIVGDISSEDVIKIECGW